MCYCQYCREAFDTNYHLPLLLNCGHFFCKNCMITKFSQKEKIVCPEDSVISRSMNELKVLNNLIIGGDNETDQISVNSGNDLKNKTKKNYAEETCKLHKEQPLTHYIEENGQLICVYCAFNVFKKNHHIDIKDINDKSKEINEKVSQIIECSHQNYENLRNAFDEIEKNKEMEEENINEIYNDLLKLIEAKRNDIIGKIQLSYQENRLKIEEKLDYYDGKIQFGESIKQKSINIQENTTKNFKELIENFNEFIQENEESSNSLIELNEMTYVFDNPENLFNLISDYGNLKQKNRLINFNNVKVKSKQNSKIENESSRRDLYDSYSVKNKEPSLKESLINTYVSPSVQSQMTNPTTNFNNNNINNYNYSKSINTGSALKNDNNKLNSQMLSHTMLNSGLSNNSNYEKEKIFQKYEKSKPNVSVKEQLINFPYGLENKQFKSSGNLKNEIQNLEIKNKNFVGSNIEFKPYKFNDDKLNSSQKYSTTIPDNFISSLKKKTDYSPHMNR